MDRISSLGAIVARILVALVFLLNGFGVIDQSIPARQLMERGGPASLVSLVMFSGRALELDAGTRTGTRRCDRGRVDAQLFCCGASFRLRSHDRHLRACPSLSSTEQELLK
jgi:hypothetical protein